MRPSSTRPAIESQRTSERDIEPPGLTEPSKVRSCCPPESADITMDALQATRYSEVKRSGSRRRATTRSLRPSHPRPRVSGGESPARLLHRWQRGLGLGERSGAEVDARGLLRDCDLSSTPSTRLASALLISAPSATAAASCVWVSGKETPPRSNDADERALFNLPWRT
jgi:hypothetical protein